MNSKKQSMKRETRPKDTRRCHVALWGSEVIGLVIYMEDCHFSAMNVLNRNSRFYEEPLRK